MAKKKTIESELTQLESIVEELESGSLDLNKMMKLFEEGMKLTQLCRGQLKEVEERIITIMKDDDELIEMYDSNGKQGTTLDKGISPNDPLSTLTQEKFVVLNEQVTLREAINNIQRYHIGCILLEKDKCFSI